MRCTVEKGKTLLVDGPACVKIISGVAEVLGAEVKSEMRIVIRQGKRLPFEAVSSFEAELSMGEGASCAERETPAIPTSWRRAAETILSAEKNTVLILGGVDSGKNGFCIYLANLALRKNRRVAVIDCDLGQSDLGPPGTVNLCFIEKPFTDLFTLFPDYSIFIGVTSPSMVVDEVLDATSRLKVESSRLRDADLIIINTDGWIMGDLAVKYKARLTETVNPDFVVAIHTGNELNPIISMIGERHVLSVEAPRDVRRRDQRIRRILRGFAYKKHLKEAKIRIFHLDGIRVEGALNLNDKGREFADKIEGILGSEVLHCEERSNSILLIVQRRDLLDWKNVKAAEMETGKRIILLQKGDERGLLASLEDPAGRMLGIGMIHDIDFRNRSVRMYTPVSGEVSRIKIGWIRLDSEGNERGLLLEALSMR
ncbi:hypothetical protein J7L18_05715 [Candidatus Bathyarchaeota archaeon]|nr:hypothetical protein [Candidatus Bathyarchaeota archaeon]